MNKKNKMLLTASVAVVLVVACYFVLRSHFQQQGAEEYLKDFRNEGEVRKYIPPEGYVPDKKTAISIAVAVWEPIYGKEQIAGEAPYQANLVDGVWVVSGSLPRLSIGGTAKALIKKDTGEILQVIHEM